MKDPIIKYTSIALVVTIVWTIIEHVLGFNTTNHAVGQYTRMITTFVFYACVAFAIWAKRKEQNGVLSFTQGFNTGASVALLYGTIVTVWFALYAEVINTQYRPSLMAFERGNLEVANASSDVMAAKMKEVEMTSGGSVLSYLLLFVFMTLFGVVVAVIASLIFKREAKTF